MRVESLRGGLGGLAVGILVVIASGVWAVDAHAADKVYYADYNENTIRRVNPDGTGLELLVSGTGAARPTTVAVDAPGGKIYWCSTGPSGLRRSNLDGTGVEVLTTTGLDFPSGIALDLTNGHVYVTSVFDSQINRYNLDGTGFVTLLTSVSLVRGIDLDVAGGKMYFQTQGGNTIERANLDGTSRETLVSIGSAVVPHDLELDLAGGKIYWVELTGQTVRRCNLDGSNVETIVTVGLRPLGLTVDSPAGKVYWTTGRATTPLIERANLDGSGRETVLSGSPLVEPWGVDVVDEAPPITCPADQDVECMALSTLTFTLGDPGGFEVTVRFFVDGIEIPAQEQTILASVLPGTVDFDFTFGGPPATDFDVEAEASIPGGVVSTCSLTVTSVDTTPPTITILGNNPETVECGDTYMDAGATASDICAGNLTSSIVTTSTVNTAAVGTYAVTYSVTDPAGLNTTVSRTVNVVDTTPPTITLLGDNPLTLECGGPAYAEPGATAFDICAGDLTSSIVITGSVNTNAVGSYPVTYTVTDPAGLQTQVVRTVDVVDTTPPTITCTLQRTLLWPPRNGLLPLGFTVTATDCQGTLPVTVTVFSDEGNGAAPFSPDATGTTPASLRLRAERAYPGDGRVYLLRMTATDPSGNTASLCKSVVVPIWPGGTSILAVLAQAAAGQAACAAVDPHTGTPAGYVQLLQFTWPLPPPQ